MQASKRLLVCIGISRANARSWKLKVENWKFRYFLRKWIKIVRNADTLTFHFPLSTLHYLLFHRNDKYEFRKSRALLRPTRFTIARPWINVKCFSFGDRIFCVLHDLTLGFLWNIPSWKCSFFGLLYRHKEKHSLRRSFQNIFRFI